MITYLLGKSSTGKFRWWSIECSELWDDSVKGFILHRNYGQVYGKTTKSPDIIVNKTKQKRNWEEQWKLQYNSEVKKQLDKGYIEVCKHPNDCAEEELISLFGTLKTNQAGVIKPQLAKQADKVTNKKIFDKDWLISRKLDGTKALFYYRDGEVHTASRGGDTYDYSTAHLRDYPPLVSFFKRNPSITLDGEIFVRGKSLAQISGAVRMEKDTDNEWLQYWIYDCYDSNNPDLSAQERYNFLVEELNHKDNIFIYKSPEDDSIKDEVRLLYHGHVSGWDNMKKLHDQWVSEGFEGAVITDSEKSYKVGARCNNLIKIKEYQDDEFEITGISEGLREEDMCFTLVTKEGKPFKAKPIGTRELKQQYREQLSSLIGKFATVKFFYYSEDGIPLQPVLKTIRDYE